MWRKRENPFKRQVNERLAAKIAGRIIGWQRQLSDLLNRKANRYGRKTQLRWFWLFCGMAVIAIISSMLITSNKSVLPHIHDPALPTHIGQSSAGPVRPQDIRQQDSLTHKTNTNGNHQ